VPAARVDAFPPGGVPLRPGRVSVPVDRLIATARRRYRAGEFLGRTSNCDTTASCEESEEHA